MSKIKRGKVGVWPVGLVGALNVESKLLAKKIEQFSQFLNWNRFLEPIEMNGKIIGFNSMWRPG